jgi:hypothetical protein
MTVQLRANVSTADTGDGLVLLDERGPLLAAQPHRRPRPSPAVRRRYPHQIAQTLADRHPVSTDQAAADIAALLERLHTAKLVTDHGQGRP